MINEYWIWNVRFLV